jgi:hypothetical protein
MKSQDLDQTISQVRAMTRNKLLFLQRYTEHLFRCYRDLSIIAQRIDHMIAKLY